MSNQKEQIWDDHVQFARLLNALGAIANVSVEQIGAVAEFMCLSPAEVQALFLSAELLVDQVDAVDE